MMEAEQDALADFEITSLVRIVPGKSTLPIDTSAEWNKGFRLVNQLIKELAEERYSEVWTDETGVERKRPVLHPQLLGYMQERRKMIDQIFKISGGEAVNEMKKETARNMANYIFKINTDKETKDKYKKDALNIIEAEIDDDES
ncbi:MAG: hypothetical protein V3V14_08250 [Saprospiraceae bacterium]